jgi:hypothetical protein
MTAIPGLAIGAAAKLSGIGGFLKAIPSWVWIALATAALLFAGYVWHQHHAKRMLDHAYSQGKVDGAAPWIAKVQELTAALERQTQAVNALVARQHELQGAAVAAAKQAEPRARQAEGVARKLAASAKVVPAKPCEPSEALKGAWR